MCRGGPAAARALVAFVNVRAMMAELAFAALLPIEGQHKHRQRRACKAILGLMGDFARAALRACAEAPPPHMASVGRGPALHLLTARTMHAPRSEWVGVEDMSADTGKFSDDRSVGRSWTEVEDDGITASSEDAQPRLCNSERHAGRHPRAQIPTCPRRALTPHG